MKGHCTYMYITPLHTCSAYDLLYVIKSVISAANAEYYTFPFYTDFILILKSSV